jgi:tubulin beta
MVYFSIRKLKNISFCLLGMIVGYSVFPSPQVSESIVEPYNAMLAAQYHIDSTDMLICFDNEALYDICTRSLKISFPTMSDRM